MGLFRCSPDLPFQDVSDMEIRKLMQKLQCQFSPAGYFISLIQYINSYLHFRIRKGIDEVSGICLCAIQSSSGRLGKLIHTPNSRSFSF